jgi:hypothetical protein
MIPDLFQTIRDNIDLGQPPVWLHTNGFTTTTKRVEADETKKNKAYLTTSKSRVVNAWILFEFLRLSAN